MPPAGDQLKHPHFMHCHRFLPRPTTRREMLLQTVTDGKRVDIPIGEGEILLLPPKVPHSPQRFADTVGLVVERKRQPEELDGFMWFCDNCDHKLYEEFLYVSDIVGQLPPVFDRFYGAEENRTCNECGTLMPLPDAQD